MTKCTTLALASVGLVVSSMSLAVSPVGAEIQSPSSVTIAEAQDDHATHDHDAHGTDVHDDHAGHDHKDHGPASCQWRLPTRMRGTNTMTTQAMRVTMITPAST